MRTEKFNFPSATGVCEINGNIYLPDDEIRLVLVIHHGMAEHQGRYQDFIKYLTDHSIAVYMYDMANHGISNQKPELTGYFGDRDGYIHLVKDFNTLFNMAKTAYPNKKIVVMGHSMGSFIVRCFTAWYNNAGFSGAIYMGTGGSNPIAGVGDRISSLFAKIKGPTYKSKLLDKMTFGSYNSRFEKRTAFDWLTRDSEIVDKYIADEYCGFLFSVKGMNDLVKLNISANTDEWYDKVPRDIPILLTSGDMDPVGNYAAGIKEIDEKLRATGHKAVTMKLYAQGRHEILNETNKDTVYSDILAFLNSI